jgi:hypothetical protein
MSMILLEPANTILYNSLEDQAADHLISGILGNYGFGISRHPDLFQPKDVAWYVATDEEMPK